MPIWYNNDGLRIKSGQEEGEAGTGGQYADQAENAVMAFDIVWDKLEPFGTVTILSDTVRIPNGWRLESAQVYTETPFTSGGSATMTIGLFDLDGTTAYDADGIDATIALTAIDASGETVTCDGALIGTDLANDQPSLVGVTVGTANYTAGKARLMLKLHKFD